MRQEHGWCYFIHFIRVTIALPNSVITFPFGREIMCEQLVKAQRSQNWWVFERKCERTRKEGIL